MRELNQHDVRRRRSGDGHCAAGQRTEVGGTYARRNLPAALASATYDDANQIATWESTALTYDDNGNLVTDGVRTYAWDVRNQLASLTGPVSASFGYDGFGRRRTKTIASTRLLPVSRRVRGHLFDRGASAATSDVW
jgi:hypothetical protein